MRSVSLLSLLLLSAARASTPPATAAGWTGTTSNAVPPAWGASTTQSTARFGQQVAAAGDVNGDGYGDLVVGADFYDHGQADEGAAFLYLGSPSGPSLTADWTAEADVARAHFGGSVASAGDVDGDGFDDLVVGAADYAHGESGEGGAFVYLGSAGGPSVAWSWSVESDQPSAHLGGSVASAGDVDGDGYGDLIVGASEYDDGEASEGAVFLYLGSFSGPSPYADQVGQSDQALAYLGGSVASAGDLNGDGYGDLVAGAEGYDDGQFDEGAAFVYLGSSTGPGATADWMAESNQSSPHFGHSVASAGDVDGDGYDDVAVGATGFTDGAAGEGAAFVYLGGASGPSVAPDWMAGSGQSWSELGTQVGSGDINGDGFADLVVGADRYEGGESAEGAAFVYFGSRAGLSTAPDWTAEANQESALFGVSVTAAGDLNADGFADVVVGQPSLETGDGPTGAAWAWYGAVDFAQDADGYSLADDCDDEDPAVNPGEAEQCNGYDDNCDGLVDDSGDPVPFHPDADADGYGDTTVTVDVCPAPAGYVSDGSDCNDADPDAWPGAAERLNGADDDCDGFADEGAGALAGSSVAYIGDLNGDGYEDLLVGAPGATDGEAEEGAASLYLGSAAGLSPAAVWVASSNQARARFGQSVAGAGDVNGDGYPDVLVGADGFDGAAVNAGRAYLYLGGGSGLPADADWTADSDQAAARLGSSVSGAGDVDGDGFDDMLVGSVGYDGAAVDEGRADLFLGAAAGPSDAPAWTVTSGQPGALLGGTVAGAGDVNGDGYADILVGAAAFDTPEVDAGTVLLYLGSASGPSAAADWMGGGDAPGAAFGTAIAGAGDVNDDGFDDVVVGAPRDEADAADQASASVYFGSAAGLSAGPDWTAQAPSGYLHTGLGVAGGCDVNRDGFTDVVVSEPGHASAKEGYGRAWLYLGSDTGPSATAAIAAEADADYVEFGWSIACAGDLNADGFADIVVGVPGEDEPEADAGTVVVQLGGVDVWSYDDPSRAPADCDEDDPSVYPGATEVCDGIDDDCDGAVDEGLQQFPWFVDADGDGYGADLHEVWACSAPAGYLAVAGDCDDGDAAVSPAATETCDGIDDDCDGRRDEGVRTTWYADNDGDGFGAASGATQRCSAPAGYVSRPGDCDDTDPAVNPTAQERCDGVDNDCDRLVDESRLRPCPASPDPPPPS